MAEAFARKYGGEGLEVASAGTMPAKNVHPEVIQAMKEKGIDLPTKKPQMLDTNLAANADLIVTMGCSVEGLCPALMLKNFVDWKLEDPKGKLIEEVRQIRDVIEQKVVELLERVKNQC